MYLRRLAAMPLYVQTHYTVVVPSASTAVPYAGIPHEGPSGEREAELSVKRLGTGADPPLTTSGDDRYSCVESSPVSSNCAPKALDVGGQIPLLVYTECRPRRAFAYLLIHVF